MKTLSEYSRLAESLVADFIKRIDRDPHGLYDPIIYALESGGKRLRPVLALAVADALGSDNAADAALAIEIFHNFTLLHDDIMDRSATRRGRPTVYKKWDEATAILSGDTMLTLATQTLNSRATGSTKALMAEFNRAAMAVYEGQQLDMDFEKRDDVSVDEYMTMISKKTSALLVGACRLGALTAGASEIEIKAFSDYAENLGLAFQLQDDLLDSFGDPVTFGKPIGGDILNDKKTWLLITAKAEDSENAIKAIYEAGYQGQEKIDAVKEVYEALGLPSRCERLIDRLTDKAIETINSIEISDEAKAFFSNLAHKLVSRDK